jgi:hypothetical protein
MRKLIAIDPRSVITQATVDRVICRAWETGPTTSAMMKVLIEARLGVSVKGRFNE